MHTLAFSSGLLVSGGDDRTIRLWDAMGMVPTGALDAKCTLRPPVPVPLCRESSIRPVEPLLE